MLFRLGFCVISGSQFALGVHPAINLYESLKRQTRYDFIWLVIDDGSDDGTEAEVIAWSSHDNPFRIVCVYKENGGLHTVYNTALEHIYTESEFQQRVQTCCSSQQVKEERIINAIWIRISQAGY